MVVFIDNMKLRAHHGVLEQERVVGTDFMVSVRVECEVSADATEHDCLDGTISYADVCDEIRNEMSVPSRLLEHVVTRIAQRVLTCHDRATSVFVRLVKCNPPMGADVAGAGVEITLARSI